MITTGEFVTADEITASSIYENEKINLVKFL
jgi:hypothetical protein